jgi:endonuclease YncB( thermonuclease family)
MMKTGGWFSIMLFIVFYFCNGRGGKQGYENVESSVFFEKRDEGRKMLEGRVVKIADGDSFTILTGKSEQVRIRLLGIDAPEKGQPYSKRSRQFLSGLIFGKRVEVYYDKTDRYNRILGDVYVDTLWVNAEMIRNGLAWRYRYSDDKILGGLEYRARTRKIGLWDDPDAINPWEWRKRMRNKHMP